MITYKKNSSLRETSALDALKDVEAPFRLFCEAHFQNNFTRIAGRYWGIIASLFRLIGILASL